MTNTTLGELVSEFLARKYFRDDEGRVFSVWGVNPGGESAAGEIHLEIRYEDGKSDRSSHYLPLNEIYSCEYLSVDEVNLLKREVNC